VEDGDWGAAPQAERARQLEKVGQSLAGAEFAAYRADLEQRIKIQILQQPEAEPAPAE
jgi:hypothetical protein